MKWLCRSFLSALVPVLLLGALAAPAEAALTRHIRPTGTSSGPGVCSITIESFGLLKGNDIGTEAPQVFNINVPIPASSTPASSATLIRNDVDTGLPADYVVTIVFGHPDLVRIERTVGTFTMSIVEDVPDQTIEEFTVYLPSLGGRELLGLFLLLTLAGALFVGSRRRTTA